MAIEVMIRRQFSQGRQARELIPLVLQLRALATMQPGYISGRTLVDAVHSGELLVISTWESMEAWDAWFRSSTRAGMEAKVAAIAGKPAEIRIYEPIVFQKHGD